MNEASHRAFQAPSGTRVSSLNLYPLPGEFQDWPLTATIINGRALWPQIAEEFAWYFDAEADEMHTIDASFGDDDTADVLTARGKIVGSFDRRLSPDQWAALLANPENISRALAA